MESFKNSSLPSMVDMVDKCPIDVEPHPVDGWRIKAKGKKVDCDEKLNTLLKNLGPYGQKYLKGRWDLVKK